MASSGVRVNELACSHIWGVPVCTRRCRAALEAVGGWLGARPGGSRPPPPGGKHAGHGNAGPSSHGNAGFEQPSPRQSATDAVLALTASPLNKGLRAKGR